MYAHVANGTVDAIGQPPQIVYDAGRWWDLRGATLADLATRGWLPVATTSRPPDTQTTTYDYSVTLVAGVATETWTARPKTQAEIDAATEAATTAAILQQLADGVATIQTVRAAANSDIATADSGQTQALAVKGQATTKRTQVAAFVPSATYKASDLTAIIGVLLDILDRQALYAQTFADDFAWRKAVDQNALTTDDALIGLARIQSGRITG